MKRWWIISFALIYLSFNAGMVVHYHFCFETFHNLVLLVQPDDCCEGDCPGCRNSSYELKIAGDYDYENILSLDVAQILLTLPKNFIFRVSPPFPASRSALAVDTGPLIHPGKHPIYLANRVFLI